VDPEEPLLFAYFDSNHSTTARNMRERERNPRFYIQKEYEVTRLLQAPTSHPRIINDTYDARMNYVFTSENQRKQIRSSILICLDLAKPFALVVSSNEPNAFPETDPEIMSDPVISFIRYIGESVRYDLIEEGFVHRIRDFKPSLFSPKPRQ
jgi:hypothetical protein